MAKRKPERRPVVLTEARDIKALAHPARLAVLDEFMSGRQLTATECAEIAGVTPSAMSYHLRALERAGIVERADPSGDGRERPWRAAGTELRIDPASVAAATAAGALIAHDTIVRMNSELADWIARSPAEDRAWREASGLAWSRLWLTLEEVQELEKVVEDFLDARRRPTPEDRPEGARRMRIGVVVFPLDEPPA